MGYPGRNAEEDVPTPPPNSSLEGPEKVGVTQSTGNKKRTPTFSPNPQASQSEQESAAEEAPSIPELLEEEIGEEVAEIEKELQEEELEAEVQEAAEEEELLAEGYVDGTEPLGGTDDEFDQKIEPLEEEVDVEGEEGVEETEGSSSVPQPEEGIATPVPTLSPTSAPTQSPVQAPALPKKKVGWNEPAPVFTVPPGTFQDSCSGLSGRIGCQFHDHTLGTLIFLAFAPLVLICLCRRYCCSKPVDTRGEYRAVAAQYGDMTFDDAFADTYSDDEQDDLEDDSWGKAGRSALEMSTLGKEVNGGLSLEEMNG